MAALVTATPVQIDLARFSRQSRNELNPMGPFVHGSDLYMALADGETNNSVRVFKCVNGTLGGANLLTWVEKDAAHSPLTGAIPQGNITPFFDSSTGIIWLLLIPHPDFTTTTHLAIASFNCATDLYTAVGPLLDVSAVDPSQGGRVNVGFLRRSNGDCVALWGDQLGPLASYFSVFHAGAWGAITQFIAGTNFIQSGILVDNSDTGHGVTQAGSGVDPNTLPYYQFSLGNSFGNEIELSIDGDDSFRVDIKFWGTKIAIAWVVDSQKVMVAISDQIPNPIFTFYVVHTTAMRFFPTPQYASLGLGIDGSLNVFWVELDYSDSMNIIDRLYMSTFDGVSTWSTPVLFYDEVANPPTNAIEKHTGSPTDQFIHTGQAIQLANTQWVYATAMETYDAGIGIQFHCTGFILYTSIVTPSITLHFDLHGGGGGLELVAVNPPPPGPPGPIVNPTQCVNQT